MVQQPVYYIGAPVGPEIAAGTEVYFPVPITNNSGKDVTCKVTGHLHQGATMGTGDFMHWPDGSEARFESDPLTIPAGRTISLGLPGGDKNWTTKDIGGDPERDLTNVILYYQDEAGNWVEYGSTEKYGIYQVPAEEYQFTIGTPEVREA